MPGQIYSARRQLLFFLSVCFLLFVSIPFCFLSLLLLLFMFAAFFFALSKSLSAMTNGGSNNCKVHDTGRIRYILQGTNCGRQQLAVWSAGYHAHTYPDIRTSYHALANFLEGIFGSMEARLLAELYVQLNLPLPHLWLLRLGLRLRLSQRQPWPSLTWIYEIQQIHVPPMCVCVWVTYLPSAASFNKIYSVK